MPGKCWSRVRLRWASVYVYRCADGGQRCVVLFDDSWQAGTVHDTGVVHSGVLEEELNSNSNASSNRRAGIRYLEIRPIPILVQAQTQE